MSTNALDRYMATLQRVEENNRQRLALTRQRQADATRKADEKKINDARAEINKLLTKHKGLLANYQKSVTPQNNNPVVVKDADYKELGTIGEKLKEVGRLETAYQQKYGGEFVQDP